MALSHDLQHSPSGSADLHGTFLGTAVARYDIDELDDLGKRRRLERFVEVRRPDGTVAKSHGERTFYGAFTGGFSAGFWNTVGSRDGWEPASFSSSRSNRNGCPAASRIEDYMDDEDLREHHASHRSITAQAEFTHGTSLRSHASAVPGGLPLELSGDVLGLQEARLGAKLLTVAATASATRAGEGQKKRYGCARPPPGFQLSAVSTASEGGAVGIEGSLGCMSVLTQSQSCTRTITTSPSRTWPFEADLERLWKAKTDLHGIGYGMNIGQSQASRVPDGRRLYMCSKKGQQSMKSTSYGAFGTGVFDMEDYDAWEEIYSTNNKYCHEEVMSSQEKTEQEVPMSALGPINPTALSAETPEGYLPGFVHSKGPDNGRPDLLPWESPLVPKGFSGIHSYPGTWKEEAKNSSTEHQRLLEFLQKHGDRRLMDPASRAELLGEPRRVLRPGRSEANTSAAGPPAAAASGPEATAEAVATGLAMTDAKAGVAASTARQSNDVVGSASAVPAAPGMLWQGLDDQQKQALMQSLGRHFVVGHDQDMQGGFGRQEPFKSDAKKQSRYAAFCLALEGKASAKEAFEDTGDLDAAVREAELQEFGRVFRMFGSDNPDTDISAVLQSGGNITRPMLQHRIVQAWAPERMLCRRWGVPEPRTPDAILQGASDTERTFTLTPLPAPSPETAQAQAPTRDPLGTESSHPPRSLFSAIFGDGGSDHEI